MARDSLNGVYFLNGKATKFIYAVFEKEQGLNFLNNSDLYKSPKIVDYLISPAVIVEWKE